MLITFLDQSLFALYSSPSDHLLSDEVHARGSRRRTGASESGRAGGPKGLRGEKRQGQETSMTRVKILTPKMASLREEMWRIGQNVLHKEIGGKKGV